MSKPKVLIQLDPDPNPSTFDSMVAIDSGIDHLVTQGSVSADNVEGLVHGAMFTRGPDDLKNTALFVGGSDVTKSEAILAAAKKCFFGLMRVSILADPNGSNTTAAAAVICAENHLELDGSTITILAGTGPVGQRVAQIIASTCTDSETTTTIRLCSRKLEKAQTVCDRIDSPETVELVPTQTENLKDALEAVHRSDVIFAAGAAAVELLPSGWQGHKPKVAIDLNAVPPAGIPAIEVMDRGEKRGDTICYGAIGVGGLKMKIHKQAVRSLFDANDRVLEAIEVYQLGRSIA